jgi:hypothetical protein
MSVRVISVFSGSTAEEAARRPAVTESLVTRYKDRYKGLQTRAEKTFGINA